MLFAFALETAAAEQTNSPPAVSEVNDALLQQGLTIHEIDKEVERLRQEEKSVKEQIVENEKALSNRQAALERKREDAGRILRAYYMGNRDHLWLLLFRMESINDALVVLDYMNLVVRNDFRVLRMYQAEYEERLRLLAELEAKEQRLQTVITDYLKQKDRLVALQKDLERKLAELTEEERKAQTEQIERLTNDWETEGLPLFESYLAELSKAMEGITGLLSDEKRLTLDGNKLFVRLTDDDFNGYLQKKSSLFESFTFLFEQDKLLIAGTYESKEAFIEGKYVLEQEPENLLRFEITSLTYNGYELPDTTVRSLQEQYDLAFRPGLLFAGLKASELQTKEGALEVKLTFEGFPLALGTQ